MTSSEPPPTDTIARLVELHGEGGLSPTVDDWHEIHRVSAGGPIVIVNLLAFRDTVVVDGDELTGAAAYDRYTRMTGDPFTRAGGRLVHLGPVGREFGTSEPGHWDLVVVTRYPSADALAGMWLDEAFVAAHRHRDAGVAASTVMVSPA